MIWCAVKKLEYQPDKFWITEVIEEPESLPVGFEWMTDVAINEFIAANQADWDDYKASIFEDKRLKIYRYIKSEHNLDPFVPPFDIDFVTGLTIKLHRKQTLVKGEVTKEEYYVNFNGTTYSDEIVEEVHTFTRNSLGFALYRTTTIKWYTEFGNHCPETKTWVKFYDGLQTIEEGISRRGNIVKYLQPVILSFLQATLSPEQLPNILTLGRAFLTQYKPQFDAFTDHSDRTISTTLQGVQVAIDHPWTQNIIPNTSTKIIEYILNELNI